METEPIQNIAHRRKTSTKLIHSEILFDSKRPILKKLLTISSIPSISTNNINKCNTKYNKEEILTICNKTNKKCYEEMARRFENNDNRTIQNIYSNTDYISPKSLSSGKERYHNDFRLDRKKVNKSDENNKNNTNYYFQDNETYPLQDNNRFNNLSNNSIDSKENTKATEKFSRTFFPIFNSKSEIKFKGSANNVDEVCLDENIYPNDSADSEPENLNKWNNDSKEIFVSESIDNIDQSHSEKMEEKFKEYKLFDEVDESQVVPMDKNSDVSNHNELPNGVKILIRGDMIGALNCFFPQLNLIRSEKNRKIPVLHETFSLFNDNLKIYPEMHEFDWVNQKEALDKEHTNISPRLNEDFQKRNNYSSLDIKMSAVEQVKNTYNDSSLNIIDLDEEVSHSNKHNDQRVTRPLPPKKNCNFPNTSVAETVLKSSQLGVQSPEKPKTAKNSRRNKNVKADIEEKRNAKKRQKSKKTNIKKQQANKIIVTTFFNNSTIEYNDESRISIKQNNNEVKNAWESTTLGLDFAHEEGNSSNVKINEKILKSDFKKLTKKGHRLFKCKSPMVTNSDAEEIQRNRIGDANVPQSKRSYSSVLKYSLHTQLTKEYAKETSRFSSDNGEVSSITSANDKKTEPTNLTIDCNNQNIKEENISNSFGEAHLLEDLEKRIALDMNLLLRMDDVDENVHLNQISAPITQNVYLNQAINFPDTKINNQEPKPIIVHPLSSNQHNGSSNSKPYNRLLEYLNYNQIFNQTQCCSNFQLTNMMLPQYTQYSNVLNNSILPTYSNPLNCFWQQNDYIYSKNLDTIHDQFLNNDSNIYKKNNINSNNSNKYNTNSINNNDIYNIIAANNYISNNNKTSMELQNQINNFNNTGNQNFYNRNCQRNMYSSTNEFLIKQLEDLTSKTTNMSKPQNNLPTFSSTNRKHQGNKRDNSCDTKSSNQLTTNIGNLIYASQIRKTESVSNQQNIINGRRVSLTDLENEVMADYKY